MNSNNSGFGYHPTQYARLNNGQLYAMFRESIYSRLEDSEKLDLLQETVNRDALEKGMVGAPQVQFADLPATESGNAANGYITVNRDMATRGIQTLEYNGQTFYHQMDDYNVQALNTVLHEDEHCFQGQIINGTIIISDTDLAKEYMANDFTYSAVLKDGTYQLGSQYVLGVTPSGYYFYYFEPTERDAYLNSENKTVTILSQITSKFGTENSFTAYEKSVQMKGYQAREREATELFQNPNFVKDVSQILQNEYFKTNVPVDARTEEAMKSEMIESYRIMQLQNAAYNKVEADKIEANNVDSKEKTKVGFEPKSVTLDEYNQSLRDSVNAYYQHAQNDPTMSQEDAITSTAEMSENYLNSVEAFQASQGTAATSVESNEPTETVSESEASVGTSNLQEGGITDDSAAVHAGGTGMSNEGESVDDGIDGGEGADDGLDL